MRSDLETSDCKLHAANCLQPRANSSPVLLAHARRKAGLSNYHSFRRPVGSRLSIYSRLVRRGLTLIELLVVIIILTTLVGAALPILAPADSDRAIREATRGLNTFITGAQARAIELRRPYGIALKRLSADTATPTDLRLDDNAVCLEVFYVEQAPPYTGFDESSAVMVALYDRIGTSGETNQVIIRFVRRGSEEAPGTDGLPISYDPDLLPSGVLRRGDVVEVGRTRYRLIDNTTDVDTNGYYVATSGDPDGALIAVPINDTGQLILPEYDNLGRYLLDSPTSPTPELPYFTAPMPYKVLRQPTTTSSEPYQLPEGVAIDLRASGVGNDQYFYVPGVHDNSFSPMIMFTPEGRVSSVHFSRLPVDTFEADNSYFDEPVVDNVFLLVGRRENIPAPLPATEPTLDSSKVSLATTDEARQELREPINWLEDESRWVVIGSQSGRIVSVENSFVDLAGTLGAYTQSNHPLGSTAYTERSDDMRDAQIYESREFTRQMGQLGGR